MATPAFYKRELAVFGALTVLGLGIFGTLKIGGSSGTAIDGHFRTTAVINADAVTAQSSTTSNITLTGVVVGDHVDVDVIAGDLGGSTSTIELRGIVTATNTVQIVFRNYAATSTQASFNAGASTLSIQGWSY